MHKSIIRLALAASTLLSTPAFAQETVLTAPDEQTNEGNDASGFIAFGPGFVPKYDGSDEYQLIPFAIADLKWKGLEFQIRGLGGRVDVASDDRLQIGPAFNFDLKRNSSSDGKGGVRFLNDVGTSIEVGGFIGYRVGGDERGQGAVTFDLTVLKDINDGHDGLLATAQVSYAALRTQKFFINVDAQTTYGDKKYTRSYFGVTPQEAAVSGLPAYRPDAGIRDIGAGLTVGYQFNERWGVVARAAGAYYVGDPKDSPIVDVGSKFQGLGGVALSYRF